MWYYIIYHTGVESKIRPLKIYLNSKLSQEEVAEMFKIIPGRYRD